MQEEKFISFIKCKLGRRKYKIKIEVLFENLQSKNQYMLLYMYTFLPIFIGVSSWISFYSHHFHSIFPFVTFECENDSIINFIKLKTFQYLEKFKSVHEHAIVCRKEVTTYEFKPK